MKITSPTMSTAIAAGLFAAGTGGTSCGNTSPDTPSPITLASSSPWSTSSGFTPRRNGGGRKAESARIAPPTGSVAPPVNVTTPFRPKITPGVESPCSASSAAITANAVPTSTVRVSAYRAPANGERARGPGRRERAEADREEMDRPAELDGLPSDGEQDRGGNRRRDRAEEERRNEPLVQSQAHDPVVGTTPLRLESPMREPAGRFRPPWQARAT